MPKLLTADDTDIDYPGTPLIETEKWAELRRRIEQAIDNFKGIAEGAGGTDGN